MKLLVTGGAGYIGSIVARQLLAAGHEVIVLDNLERGHREAVPRRRRLVVADLLDREAVDAASARGSTAPCISRRLRSLSESVSASRALLPHERRRDAEPARGDGRRRRPAPGVLLDLRGLRAARRGPDRRDGRAAARQRLRRLEARRRPDDPRLLHGHGLGAVSLRYFNVAGASGDLGEDHDPETHLIPNILRAALGTPRPVEIYGTDYPTPDGTAVRDYIHVEDLAARHLLALDGARDNLSTACSTSATATASRSAR